MDVVPRQLDQRKLLDLVDLTHATEREIARTIPEVGRGGPPGTGVPE